MAGSPLLAAGGQIVVLEDRKVSIGSLCAARKAKLRRTKKGTQLTVVFPKGKCTGIKGKVTLTALITDACATFTGKLKAPKAGPVRFTAATSICGDAVTDPLGEDCDTSATGCGTNEGCSGTCSCVQIASNKSGPIDLTPDGKTVVAANSDTDSVTFFDVGANGTLTKTQEVTVGHEPRSVTTLVKKPLAYVANTVSGTVSVLNVVTFAIVATIDVGTEPWAVVASPNGNFVYVANANDDSVQVIDTSTNQVIKTIAVGRSPRALAVTSDGDADDTDEFVYAPNYFARPRAGFTPPSSATLGGTAATPFPAGSTGQPIVGEGIFDDSREAVIDVIRTQDNAVVDHIVLAPVADTGFKVARGAFVTNVANDTPRTIFADGATDGTVAQNTGAFPNLLQSIVLFDGRGFVPNSAASPEPPLRLNTNVQSLLSVFDIGSRSEIADQTFNLNKGINFDVPPGLLDAQIRDNTDRLFPSAPVDIACSETTGKCWVVSQGSDFIVRMDFDATTKKPTINAPTAAGSFATSPVVRIFTIDPANATTSGRNPRGIVLSANGTRGYVYCPTTRDVIVADLSGNTVLQRVRSSELPTDATKLSILRGKIDFFTSRPFWSDRGWGGCWSCHPDGRTDNVTWSFEAGPRQTVSLDGTFSNTDGLSDQRLLNWTPVRDENPDFELNTRGVFGGRGFITTTTDVNADGITPDSDPNVHNYGPASSNRSTQQTDITNWIALAIRSPIAPPVASGNATRGRNIFLTATPSAGGNCVACHSGPKWTTSRVTFDPAAVNPIPGTDTGIVNLASSLGFFLNGFNSTLGLGRACEGPPPAGATKRLRIMRQVGTFDAVNPIELRHGAISPINTVQPALTVAAAFGADGFNTPTLIGIFDTAPYFRAGQATTLEKAFGIGTDPNFLPAARAHWRAGTGGVANILDSDASAVTDLVAFLRTIDDTTTPFPAADLAPDDPVFADASALCDCQLLVPLGTPAIDCAP